MVAKSVIAFANRDPDEAGRTLGGVALLILGVEPQNLRGIQPIDNADLEAGLAPYLGGGDGPRWQPHWVRVDDKTVLIIEIHSPSWGDEIYCLHKDFDRLRAGTIFVRKLARSDRATPQDIRRLTARRMRGATHGASVRVELADDSTFVKYEDSVDRLPDFVERERKRLLGPLDTTQSLRHATYMSLPPAISAAFGLFEQPEDRSPDQFREQVEAYLLKLPEKWERFISDARRVAVPQTTLRIVNESDQNYQDLEVSLHVEGDAKATPAPVDNEADPRRVLPPSPRAWGPRRTDPFGSTSYLHLPHVARSISGPSMRIENGGSFRIAFPPRHLRPQASAKLGSFIALIPGSRTDEVVATWRATATNVDGVTQGEIELPKDLEVIDPYFTLFDE